MIPVLWTQYMYRYDTIGYPEWKRTPKAASRSICWLEVVVSDHCGSACFGSRAKSRPGRALEPKAEPHPENGVFVIEKGSF